MNWVDGHSSLDLRVLQKPKLIAALGENNPWLTSFLWTCFRGTHSISDFQKLYLTPGPNQQYTDLVLSRYEGRFAIVTSAGWDAVDAAASGMERNRRAGFP
jgi:hypothetical protein